MLNISELSLNKNRFITLTETSNMGNFDLSKSQLNIIFQECLKFLLQVYNQNKR